MRIFEDVGEGRGIVRFSSKELAHMACLNARDYLDREARLAGLVEPLELWDGGLFAGGTGIVVVGTIGPQFDTGD